MTTYLLQLKENCIHSFYRLLKYNTKPPHSKIRSSEINLWETVSQLYRQINLIKQKFYLDDPLIQVTV